MTGEPISRFLFKYRRACYYTYRNWKTANQRTREMIAEMRLIGGDKWVSGPTSL